MICMKRGQGRNGQKSWVQSISTEKRLQWERGEVWDGIRREGKTACKTVNILLELKVHVVAAL